MQRDDSMGPQMSFGGLVGSIVDLAGRLLGVEIALLKAEMSANTNALVLVAVFYAVAGVAGFIGLLFLLLAAGLLLVKFGLEIWAAMGVVAIVWLLLAVVCVLIARRRGTVMTLYPERTLAQVKLDVTELRRSMTHG